MYQPKTLEPQPCTASYGKSNRHKLTTVSEQRINGPTTGEEAAVGVTKSMFQVYFGETSERACGGMSFDRPRQGPVARQLASASASPAATGSTGRVEWRVGLRDEWRLIYSGRIASTHEARWNTWHS